MSSDDEMNALDTRKARGPARKRQRTVSPDPVPKPKSAKSAQASTSAATPDEDEDIVAIDPPPNPKSKGKARQKHADPPAANPPKSTTAKGKEPQKRVVSGKPAPPPPPEPMDIDDGNDTEEEKDSGTEAPPKPRPRVVNGAGTSKKQAEPRSTKDSVSSRELDRWKQKVTDLESQRDTLAKQLEEAFILRHTEPEEALDQLKIQYEAHVKTQETLIKELTSQLARVEPLTRTKQTAALHFMTREAADEEKKLIEEENTRLQEVIKQKDAAIATEKKRNSELERSVKLGRQELDAEIERSKELLSKASRYQPGLPRLDESKNTELIKFYEDTSNLLVTNVRHEPNPDATQDDTIFTCIYTYVSSTAREDEQSLNFSLRIHGDEAEDDRSVKYKPLLLEQESPIFRQKLDFLGDAFTFPKSQQALFLTTMRDKLGEAIQETEAEINGEVEQ
ncbi:hypothetical protein BJ138DRAFT_1090466 [Hygrophoropsis aurantiaca]|uniref:Uncharacterized protein n=1 Tax=Hygrophoropsis aurantiaca TaxID=72124 RepID=A0ACB8A6Z9_9AGAM|nr:hypothetical protein BJ138DRAFT_1090466 [Hygrophoropsis aurantiaca]